MRGQRKAVLDHLKTYGQLTSMEAIDKYGATRLAAIIHAFRKMGYDIDTQDLLVKNRYGESSVVANYIYKGGKK